MPKVEALKEKVVRLKKKLTETKDNKELIQAVTKSLKRAQRRINTLTGKKLAAKHKGEEGEKKPAAAPTGAPAAVKPAAVPASAPAAAKPAAVPAPAPVAAAPAPAPAATAPAPAPAPEKK
ncbi:MAG: hypothetical protein V1701_12385 [Planctomycetota bacterium]